MEKNLSDDYGVFLESIKEQGISWSLSLFAEAIEEYVSSVELSNEDLIDNALTIRDLISIASTLSHN